MITIEGRGFREAAEDIKRKGKAVGRHLQIAGRRIGVLVSSHIKEEKLTNQVLHVRTGHLRRHIKYAVEKEGDDVVVTVGVSDVVPYGRIHELGGRSGRGLRTVIPPRLYIEPSYQENRAAIIDIADKAMADVTMEGR